MEIWAEAITWKVLPTKDSERASPEANKLFPIALSSSAISNHITVHSRESIIKLRDALNEVLEQTRPDGGTGETHPT